MRKKLRAFVAYDLFSEDSIEEWQLHTLLSAKLNDVIVSFNIFEVLPTVWGIRTVLFSMDFEIVDEQMDHDEHLNYAGELANSVIRDTDAQVIAVGALS